MTYNKNENSSIFFSKRKYVYFQNYCCHVKGLIWSLSHCLLGFGEKASVFGFVVFKKPVKRNKYYMIWKAFNFEFCFDVFGLFLSVQVCFHFFLLQQSLQLYKKLQGNLQLLSKIQATVSLAQKVSIPHKTSMSLGDKS